jgi:transcriptional regulator with XRE-family HTH domain
MKTLNPRKALARNLKRVRAAMSQSELAERSGQRRALISDIEREKANPTLDTLAAISTALKVWVAELLEKRND